MSSVCIFCGHETVISSASKHYCTSCGSEWSADGAKTNAKQEIIETQVSETNEEYDYFDFCSPI